MFRLMDLAMSDRQYISLYFMMLGVAMLLLCISIGIQITRGDWKLVWMVQLPAIVVFVILYAVKDQCWKILERI